MVCEVHGIEGRGIDALLRNYQFEFLSGLYDDGGVGLWAHAHPIDAFGNGQGTIGFDGN